MTSTAGGTSAHAGVDSPMAGGRVGAPYPQRWPAAAEATSSPTASL